jgi:Domain of unknown function (DUF4352)
MRRPVAVGVLSACLLLAACTGDDDEAVPTESVDTVTVVVTETVATTSEESQETGEGSEEGLEVSAGIGDTLSLANPDGSQISVTLLKVVDPASFEERFAPAAGMRVVAIRLRVENSGNSDYMDTPGSGAALLTADEAGFGTGITPTKNCPDLGSPTLHPGDQITGCLTFDVPEGTKVSYFTLTSNAGFTPEAERGIWRLGN